MNEEERITAATETIKHTAELLGLKLEDYFVSSLAHMTVKREMAAEYIKGLQDENAALRAFVGIPDGVTVSSVEDIMALPVTFGLPIETLLKAAARSSKPGLTIKDAETKNPPTANC